MFTASVDLTGFRRAAAQTIDSLGFGIRDSVRNAAQEGAAEAKAVGRFQNRTGLLRQGIIARFVASSGRSAEWAILSLAPYSRYVESGTRPHVIEPRNAVALRFAVNGQTVFARRVNHPGTAPMPFMGPALLKAERVLYRDLHSVIARLDRFWS